LQPENIFKSIPGDLSNEVFDLLAQSSTVKIERIISRGHSSPETGWFDQGKNEWIILMKGEAIICFEDMKEINLKTGDYINIPAHEKHKVKWTAPGTETVWLAIFY